MTSDLPELLFVVNRHAEEQHCYQEARNNTELKTRPMVWFFNATCRSIISAEVCLAGTLTRRGNTLQFLLLPMGSGAFNYTIN